MISRPVADVESTASRGARIQPARPAAFASIRSRRAIRGVASLIALGCALLIPAPAAAIIYTYDNTTAGATGFVTSNPNCDSGTGALDRTFVVSDSFTVATIAVGLNVSHTERGDYRVRLIAPDATAINLFAQGADADDNYDILMYTSGSAEGAVDDASADPTADPFFNRLVNIAAINFYAGSATGTWTLRLCDRDGNGINGTFNRARLVLTDATAAPGVCTSFTTYEWADNGNDTAFSSVTRGDVTLTLTGTSDATGDANNPAGPPAFVSFTTDTDVMGADTGFYFHGMILEAGEYESAMLRTSWSFSTQVSDLRWVTLDNDWSSSGAPWEDYTRTRGFNGAGAAVPFTIVDSVANDVAGDLTEGDTGNIASSSPDANITYRFTRPVSTMQNDYMAGDDWADPGQQWTGIGNPLWCTYDYGDAPDTYGTLLATAGARHVLGLRELWMGTNRPDGESEGAPDPTAQPDDATTIGGIDDEDGVSTFPACPNDGTYSVTVSASDIRTSGADGALRGYIDWDRDGNFTDANEQSASITVTRTNADPSNYVVTWSSVPASCGGTTVTYARFRFSTAAISSPTGSLADGEVEDYQITASTLPVTLASIETVVHGPEITVRWTTASETGNAGFRIWGHDARGAMRLLGTYKSQGSDSFAVQRYEAVVPGKGILRIEVEDVSAFGGMSRIHGPFAVGESYGAEPASAEVDWASIKSATGLVSAVERMAAAESGEASLLEMASTTTTNKGRLLVREEGIHRVTFEQLLAAGVDLGGVKNKNITIFNNGAVVPRHVAANGGTFGPGAAIEFVARPALTLASPVDVYTIKAQGAKGNAAAAMPLVGGSLGTVDASDLHESETVYSFASPNGDPWYGQGLLAWGGAASLTRSFDLPDLAAGPVALDLRTWGIGDWPGASPQDHHVVVRLNGSEIADQRFDGPIALDLTLDVTSLVQPSGNALEVVAPGDTGFDLDYIAFDGFTVRYPRSSVAIDGRFAAKNVPAGNVAIGGFDPNALVSVWRLAGATAQRSQQTANGGQVFSPGAGDLYASAGAAIRTPAILADIPAAKTSSNADYVIVTHLLFADSLADLVALQEAKGLSTEVVTVDRIYSAYSDHAASPAAIRSFLSASIAKGLQYALIVGADSSDPYDHLGLGSVSYVPTDYLPLNPYVQFSPTDESLVDAGGDGLGDAPIGRLPARTTAELDAMVAKLVDWEAQVASGRTALLSAGISDTEAALLDAINDSYAASLADWSTTTAAVDELGSAAARAAVLEALNGGTKLVSYVGHSSMGQWDWTPLLRWQDAADLTNEGAPNLVTAWGCWNSYYVEPTIESLAARLLRQPDAGPAGAIGATTLTSESSHQALGNLFFQQVNAGATRVGDAFHAAKQALAAQGGAQDAILGMTLLGDPAMSLPPVE